MERDDVLNLQNVPFYEPIIYHNSLTDTGRKDIDASKNKIDPLQAISKAEIACVVVFICSVMVDRSLLRCGGSQL